MSLLSIIKYSAELFSIDKNNRVPLINDVSLIVPTNLQIYFVFFDKI